MRRCALRTVGHSLRRSRRAARMRRLRCAEPPAAHHRYAARRSRVELRLRAPDFSAHRRARRVGPALRAGDCDARRDLAVARLADDIDAAGGARRARERLRLRRAHPDAGRGPARLRLRDRCLPDEHGELAAPGIRTPRLLRAGRRRRRGDGRCGRLARGASPRALLRVAALDRPARPLRAVGSLPRGVSRRRRGRPRHRALDPAAHPDGAARAVRGRAGADRLALRRRDRAGGCTRRRGPRGARALGRRAADARRADGGSRRGALRPQLLHRAPDVRLQQRSARAARVQRPRRVGGAQRGGGGVVDGRRAHGARPARHPRAADLRGTAAAAAGRGATAAGRRVRAARAASGVLDSNAPLALHRVPALRGPDGRREAGLSDRGRGALRPRARPERAPQPRDGTSGSRGAAAPRLAAQMPSRVRVDAPDLSPAVRRELEALGYLDAH